jgi:uncharacterized protein (TIGR00106 family)
MKVTADFCIVPLGVGVSVGQYVAACERVLEEAGLRPQIHAYGTNVEGEWQAVFDGLQRCHEVVHELGAPRVHTTVRLGTRTDRAQSNADKVQSVRRHLGE